MELKNAIMGINYALAAEYWSPVERQTLNDLYDALMAQLEALSGVTAAPSLAPASATSMSTNNAGQYNQSQQASQQNNLSQTNQTTQMNVMNLSNNELKQRYSSMSYDIAEPMIETTSQDLIEFALIESEMTARGFLNNNSNTGGNQQSQQENQQSQQEPPMPNHFQWMEHDNLKQTYGDMTQELASDPSMENDSMFMRELEMAENEMAARGFLNNNGMQGAPRKLGILSGGLGGATTSTSSSSAHGPMRAHVARMNQADPRKDLYEY
jgi:hypothetical protein